MDDPRNVIDYFKHTETLLIKGDLDQHRTQLRVAMEGFRSDFNFSSVIRSANAFLAKEVIALGGSGKSYDKRGSVGTYHYEHIAFVPELEDFKAKLLAERTQLVILEGSDDAVDIMDHSWAENSCLLVGAEAIGVSDEILGWVRDGSVPGAIAYIPQWGSVRSLNAAVAASIGMFSYASQIKPPRPPWATSES